MERKCSVVRISAAVAVALALPLVFAGCIFSSSDANDGFPSAPTTLECTASAGAVMAAAWTHARAWNGAAFLTEMRGFEDYRTPKECASGIGEPWNGDGRAYEWQVAFESPNKPELFYRFHIDASKAIRGSSEVPKDQFENYYGGGPDLSSWTLDTASIAARLSKESPSWKAMERQNGTVTSWMLAAGPAWSVHMIVPSEARPCFAEKFDARSGRIVDDGFDYCRDRLTWDELQL